MKTYNLGAGKLHRKLGDEDCYCVLGIFLKENGVSDEALDNAGYELLTTDSLSADTLKLIRYMASLFEYSEDELNELDETAYPIAWRVNDRVAEEDGKVTGYRFSADQIKAGLAHVGINVELNDVRGKSR